MSRRSALTAVASGLVLVGISAALLLGRGDGSAGDVGAVEDRVRRALVDADEPSPAPVPDTWQPPAPDATEGGTPPASEFVAPSLFIEPGPEPIGLRIAALGVEAPVGSYGVDGATGEMEVPDSVAEVGWYRFGAAPGDAGSAVLAAHVDVASQGPGVFFDLGTLEPGDLVIVDMDDGSRRFFAVSARKVYDKDELPLDVIFARKGPPVLTLITCGGGFNRDIRSYDSNVVVYAEPVVDHDDVLIGS